MNQLIDSVPNKNALLSYVTGGTSMCQDIKACTLEDENAFTRYWQIYQSQHDGMPPHNVEALDEGKMEADLKDGGLPAYPPGWRPPLPKGKVGTKTPPEELAGDLEEASGEAPVARKGGTGTPSFKRIGTAFARRLHGVRGGEGGNRAWALPKAQKFVVR